jgi:HEAT repeat protein
LTAALLLGNPHVAEPQETKEPKQVEKKAPEKKAEPEIDKIDEEILRRADLATDADALVEFLRKRTLPEQDRPALVQTVRRLNASNFGVREKATQDLIKRGVAVLDVLRSAQGPELELKRRIENVIQRIRENDVAPETGAAVVRVLAQRKPKDLIAVLLAYLPSTDSESVAEEIRATLAKNGLVDGKAHPLLLAGLTDGSAVRRAAAGEALGRAAYADHKDALRKLLADPDVLVRYRVARTLALARERDAVAVVIDTLPDLPLNEAWRAEDLLLQFAVKTPPPEVAMGNSAAAAKKCADAWRAWWKEHGAAADLAKLEETPRTLGRTLIVLLDEREVMEIGIDNRPRWEIKNINLPLDAQLLGEDRVLIAEYNSNRVIERNLNGEVLWQRNVAGPLVAQRLPNGNTFIATATTLLEYDKDQNEVVNIPVSENGLQTIMKAMKAPSGEIVCMRVDGQVVRYDARGNEKSTFPISVGLKLFGGRVHVQPNGRVLVPHNAEGKVAEYDAKGKIIWEIPFEQPIAAMRLPNGNTLITSMSPGVGAVEVDRAGAEVWSFRHSSNTRVTRAIRR